MPTLRPAARAAAALAVLAAAGCATPTHTLAPSAEPDRLAWANALLASDLAVVTFTDGTRAQAQALRVERDSTSWVDLRTGVFQVVPTASVRHVEREDVGRSTRRSAVVGGIVGAVVGGALGAFTGRELAGCSIFGCVEPTGAERARAAVTVGLWGAAAGGHGGGLLGALAGIVNPSERFVFVPAPAAASRPGSDAQSRAGAAGPPPTALRDEGR